MLTTISSFQLWGDGHLTDTSSDADRLGAFKSIISTPPDMMGFYEPDWTPPDSSNISPTSAASTWSTLLAPSVNRERRPKIGRPRGPPRALGLLGLVEPLELPKMRCSMIANNNGRPLEGPLSTPANAQCAHSIQREKFSRGSIRRALGGSAYLQAHGRIPYGSIAIKLKQVPARPAPSTPSTVGVPLAHVSWHLGRSAPSARG